ncbi:40S ribosomal protein S2 [Vulpes lagopus]
MVDEGLAARVGGEGGRLAALGAPEWEVSAAAPGGQSRGHRARGGKAEDKEWIPVTKLGCLVKDMKVTSPEEIYLFSLPIKV